MHHYWIPGGGDNGCFIQKAHSQAFSRVVDSSAGDGSPAPAACPPCGFGASVVRHDAPCGPHAPHTSVGQFRQLRGSSGRGRSLRSHDESSAPLRVPRRNVCIRNSAKRGPLYHPCPASPRSIMEGQRDHERRRVTPTSEGRHARQLLALPLALPAE